MARNTEPRLAAPEGIAEEQRTALALFLDALRGHAAEVAAVLSSYNNPGEIIADSHNGSRSRVECLNGRILRVTGPLFETEADLEAEPDTETVTAMRRDITHAARNGASREQRRVVRMATYAGEVAGWLAQQELMEYVDDVSSVRYQHNASAPQEALALQFMEPGSLSETA